MAFDSAETLILRNHLEEWKASEGKARSMVVKRACMAAKELEVVQKMKHEEWNERKRAYKRWFYNHGRTEKEKDAKTIGNDNWTARKVIMHPERREISDFIEKKWLVKAGEPDFIKHYQAGVKLYMEGMMEEETGEAERLAKEWNNTSPPDDVKAKMAEQHLEKYAKEFVKKVWRQCGARVVILHGWKNDKGSLLYARHDFNDELGDGKAFDGWGGVEKRWGEYAKEALIKADGADADTDTDSDASRAPQKKKPEPLDLVTYEGCLMIGDLKDISLRTMKAILQGWVTGHYRNACGKKASVPWTKIADRQFDFIDHRYLPIGFKFREPFRLKKEEVLLALEYWREWQVTHPNDVFKFDKWLDASEELQDAVEVGSDVEERQERGRSVDRGKGKEKAILPPPDTEGDSEVSASSINRERASATGPKTALKPNKGRRDMSQVRDEESEETEQSQSEESDEESWQSSGNGSDVYITLKDPSPGPSKKAMGTPHFLDQNPSPAHNCTPSLNPEPNSDQEADPKKHQN
ncbi:hypothetical protein HYDPIDRAFT_27988 [Hydnomerulius pinastri MD-312]|uniref:Uncharacterized protein n=1 Tax=Hydnomerulius pinastri MD-312 TaxID=994086 RepID=A0A0C9WFZ0_9AGAM|nr:hypothetical protein HYDPIDRAFT_27988 [Hydnomerulius pinastri MD-312]